MSPKPFSLLRPEDCDLCCSNGVRDVPNRLMEVRNATCRSCRALMTGSHGNRLRWSLQSRLAQRLGTPARRMPSRGNELLRGYVALGMVRQDAPYSTQSGPDRAPCAADNAPWQIRRWNSRFNQHPRPQRQPRQSIDRCRGHEQPEPGAAARGQQPAPRISSTAPTAMHTPDPAARRQQPAPRTPSTTSTAMHTPDPAARRRQPAPRIPSTATKAIHNPACPEGFGLH